MVGHLVATSRTFFQDTPCRPCVTSRCFLPFGERIMTVKRRQWPAMGQRPAASGVIVALD